MEEILELMIKLSVGRLVRFDMVPVRRRVGEGKVLHCLRIVKITEIQTKWDFVEIYDLVGMGQKTCFRKNLLADVVMGGTIDVKRGWDFNPITLLE